MNGARNVKGGLVLLAGSLVLGLGLSLWSFDPIIRPPAGYERYDALPRRLMRLAHVASVMLPLINVLAGLVLDRLALPLRLRMAASLSLLFGAAALPLSLALQALVPAAAALHLAGPPAVAFTLGACLLAAGALRTPAAGLLGPWPSPGAPRAPVLSSVAVGTAAASCTGRR